MPGGSMIAGAAEPVRVAMWSGPRNISTAMMRSWENRGDAAVWDEPFYAHYLRVTGLDHPGRDSVIAAHESDAAIVAAALVGPVPDGRTVFYQKHMPHHMLAETPRDWFGAVRHAFLIRDPREVLASYVRTRERVVLDDIGVVQQVAVFDDVCRLTGRVPPVFDARDVLENPRGMLSALCAALDVPFTDRMLSWPPGARPTDGAWSPYWYANVLQSTGFAPYRPPTGPLPDHLEVLAVAAEPHYRRLHDVRVRLAVEPSRSD